MKSAVAAIVLLIAPIASAQQGAIWYGGPWQPSRVAPGYNFYNSSAPIYPVAGNPFGAGGYGYWQQRAELRRLRFEIEEANFNQRWGR